MGLTWAYADNSNILPLNQRGTAITANAPETFVLLHALRLNELKAHFRQFQAELRQALFEVHAMTPVELSEWCGSEKYSFPLEICPPWCCVAFKKDVPDGRRLPWMRHGAVARTLMDRDVLPISTPTGRQRTNTVRGTGGIANVLQALSLQDQRTVLADIFFAHNLDLDDITRLLGQSSVVGLCDVESALKADDFSAVMDRLVKLTEASLFEQTASARGVNKGMGRGHGRRYAAPWFMAYLAREGELLWPSILPDNGKLLFPRVLKPFLWTLFGPRENAALGLVLGESARSNKVSEYTLPVLRHLLLTTNFLHLSEFELAHFLHLKSAFGSEDKNRHFGHGVNLLLRETLGHYGLTYEDLGEDAGFFGGGRRINSEHGREAFSWVDQPSKQKPRLYQKVTGNSPPKEFPDYVRRWAQELRALLPAFGVSEVSLKVNELNHWLVYLIDVGEDYAPHSWEQIDRQRHINSGGNPAYRTFLDFVRTHNNARANSYISTLKQAWTLAATQHGFAGTASCPVDPAIDRLSSVASRRPARTRRLSLDEHLLITLIAENRRHKFAFGRSLGLYDREVLDHVDRKRKLVFWPALPIMMDMILNTGMRKGSAQWQDSGEGDDLWAEPGRQGWIANPLSTATPGRQMGFLRFADTGPNTRVLGMFLAVAKTGPYSVPWVDEATAQLFIEMRDWQIKYNPRRTPILATRDALRKRYSDEGDIPAIYPVFRDPDSRQGHPPVDQTLYFYWCALLKRCEEIINVERRIDAEERGIAFRAASFFDSENKPLWDIHSLRVTTVSTLLDAGVPPSIVAELVGHHCLAMTLYYRAINNAATHDAILRGMEARRARALEDLQHLDPSDDPIGQIEAALGGLVRMGGDANIAAELLGEICTSQSSTSVEFYADGICAGGDCSTGGEAYKGTHLSVFRPRACSRCRFRVTGPAFINGLVLRLNSLMVEIKNSMDIEARLNEEIATTEDAGGSTMILEGLVRRERELRDNLWAEWCAELATIKECERLMASKSDSENLPVMASLAADELETQLRRVHEFALLQQLFREEEVISGAIMAVPAGAREKRDLYLLQIAGQSDLSRYFYQCAPEVRSRALHAFGNLLLRHAPETSEEAVKFFDSLLDGSVKVVSQQGLATDFSELMATLKLSAVDEPEG